MNTVVDSGIFLAFVRDGDADHGKAATFFEQASQGRHGAILAPEAVYVEVMNYLRRKPARKDTCQSMRTLRRGPGSPVQWLDGDADVLDRAEAAYFRHFDARLSMTDAIVLVTAQQMGAKVATFDSGFRGLVAVVP